MNDSTLLHITLESDGCFGGSHRPNDDEVHTCQELDSLGLPMIGGKALKGLLVEQASLLFGLEPHIPPDWEAAAGAVFGLARSCSGSSLHIGSARLPEEQRRSIEPFVRSDPNLSRLATRAATLVRWQTRIDVETGTADPRSLRATRLARRGLMLEAPLTWLGGSFYHASIEEKAVLAVAALLVRRGGLHRSRGWGKLAVEVVHNLQPVTREWADPFLRVLQRTPQGGQ